MWRISHFLRFSLSCGCKMILWAVVYYKRESRLTSLTICFLTINFTFNLLLMNSMTSLSSPSARCRDNFFSIKKIGRCWDEADIEGRGAYGNKNVPYWCTHKKFFIYTWCKTLSRSETLVGSRKLKILFCVRVLIHRGTDLHDRLAIFRFIIVIPIELNWNLKIN